MGCAMAFALSLRFKGASCRPSDPITTRLTTKEFTRGRRTGWTAVSLQRRLHNLAGTVEKKLRHRADRPVFQRHNANWPRRNRQFHRQNLEWRKICPKRSEEHT